MEKAEIDKLMKNPEEFNKYMDLSIEELELFIHHPPILLWKLALLFYLGSDYPAIFKRLN